MTIHRWTIVLLAVAFRAHAEAPDEANALDDTRARASYALGVEAATNLKRYALDIDPDLMMQGLREALAGSARLTEEEVRVVLRELRAQAKRNAVAARSGAPSTRGFEPGVVDADFAFKVDPRLTRGLYMGDRWISRPTFVGANGQDSVTARITGRDARGAPIALKPLWIPADAEMMTVTPSEGSEVTITVLRTGESSVRVIGDGIDEELMIKATRNGDAINVHIAAGG